MAMERQRMTGGGEAMTEKGAAKSIRKSIKVARPVEAAFQVFVDMRWWPRTHSYRRGQQKEVLLEGRVGGRFFERYADGGEFEIGKVLTYDPPRRVVFTWKDPEWERPTEVDVAFYPDGPHTRVELIHSGWEHVGPNAKYGAGEFGRGWDEVLAAYAA